MNFRTLDDFDFKGKTVLVRADLNSPFDEKKKKISDNERIREHSKTIKELAGKKAKVVVLAHQGRKCDPDFIHLDQHAKLLTKHVGKKVQFVDDIIGSKAIKAIKSLKPGNILLLDNVRFLDEETLELPAEDHTKSNLVKTLAPLFDYFVSDGFSAAHRSHASVVGFAKLLPAIAGRVMEKEINSVEKILLATNSLFVLGGAKVEECISIMESLFKNKPDAIGKVLTSGVLSELFLIAKGKELGKGTQDFLTKKDYLKFVPAVKNLIDSYGDKIELPVDLAIEMKGKRKEIATDKLPVEQQIMDIGKKTIKKYSAIIKNSKAIIVKGPAGVYEKRGFETGTKSLLQAITSSKAFSLVGGGDTSTAIEKLKINKKKFSYVSLGGGALITYLSGKPMPGIEVLIIDKA